MSSRRPTLLGALSVTVVVGMLLFWFMGAATNEDPLWFVKSFHARADWIVVYWDGATYMFFPDDPEYESIMTAFSKGISHWSGYEGSVGMSDETLETYRNDGRLLELHFNDPVRVHTRYLYSEARNFFVPLAGTHAEWRRVFAGLTDRPRIGVLNMNEQNFKALVEASTQAVVTRGAVP